MKTFKSAAAIALLAALAAGCSGSGAGSVPSTATPGSSSVTRGTERPSDTLGGVGNMSVFLTDAPPVINGITPTAINLGIDAVQVVNGYSVTTIASYSTPYVVNVMENPGNPTTPIGIGQVYDGAYTKLRFVIDVASSNIVANGQTMPIQFETQTPTQSSVYAGNTTNTTGSSSTVNMTVRGVYLVDGQPASALQADFNAMESLNMNSSGQIVARPTLFAVPDQLAGKADGRVLNASGAPVSGATVVAFSVLGTVANTTTTDANGNYDLHTLGAGSYQLMVFNTYTTASGQQLNATGNGSSNTYVKGPWVNVQAGQTTAVGTIAD